MKYDAASLNAKIKGWKKGIRVALFANSQPRLATYLPLAKEIQKAGHSIILLRANQIKATTEDLQGYEDIEIGGFPQESISEIRGLQVFFSSEIITTTPKGARNVRIVHSLPDKRLATNYSSQLKHKPHLASTADYLAVAVRQLDRHWRTENYTPRVEGRLPGLERGRRKHLDIVPAGYPKLEYLFEKIPAEAGSNCLVYCPTSPDVSHSKVRTLGADILRALLERFPGFQIVFRPYPGGETRDLASIREEFQAHSRFTYDDTLTGIEFFRHAAMVVTDNSSAAVSYSLATARPSIFFSDDIHRPEVASDPLGYRVSTIEQLLASMEDGLSRPEFWSQKIQQERDSHLYNVGTASQYLASKLPLFAAGKSDPGWLSIPRKRLFADAFSKKELAEIEEIRKITRFPIPASSTRETRPKTTIFGWNWSFGTALTPSK